MRLLRFLSRVAFICNICYLLATLTRYVNLPDSYILSTIITLGWLLSILVNILVNGWILVAWAFGKKKLDVPRWLMIVNFIFFVVQLLILFFFSHDSGNS